MTGYRCVHVPTGGRSGRSGVWGWLLLVAGGVVAWELIGPGVILGPIAAAIAAAALVWGVRRRRARGWAAAASRGVTLVTTVPVGLHLVTCAGCGWRTAVAVLAVAGHQIPVCVPCQRLALRRITAGHARLPGGGARHGR